MLRRKVGVAKRHLNCFMAHQFLHRPDVHALHHEIAGERVPQAVPGEVRNLGILDALLKPRARTIGGFAGVALAKDPSHTVGQLPQDLQSSHCRVVQKNVPSTAMLASGNR